MHTHKDGGRNKVQLVLLEIGANIKQKNQIILEIYSSNTPTKKVKYI